MGKKEVGSLGERLAAAFLRGKGFAIVEMNYRKPWGEVDIVAKRGNCWHFVEVKSVSREISEQGSRENTHQPEELAHERKLDKVARTAELYMAEKGYTDYQLDVVTVLLDHKNQRARCKLYEQVL